MKMRKDPPLVLVLGGTAEARELAERLTRRSDLDVIAARDLGSAGDIRSAAVLDARHPFAKGEVSTPAPVLRLWRPPWVARPGDDWTEVKDGRAAARLIPEGATVFVATGRGRLSELAGLKGREVWWRRRGGVDAPFPFDAGGWLTEEGPFTEAEERELFGRLGVDWLILQNAGGEGAFPKLAAARALDLRVAMIRRPPRPMPSVDDIDAALGWLDERIADLRNEA